MALLGRRGTGWATVLALLVAAGCTTSSTPAPSTSSTDPNTTTAPAPSTTTSQPEVELPLPTEEVLAALPGMLVIQDGQALVAARPNGSNSQDLPSEGSQPTWAPDGTTLAWSTILDTERPAVAVAVPGGQPVLHELSFLPFYYAWSPTGTHLGMLGNGASGTIEFDVLSLESGTTAKIDAGAPFYFDWSPEGDAVVAHVGMRELRIIEVPSGADRHSVPSTGTYQAPQWTDDGIVYQEEAPSAIQARGLRLQERTGQRLVRGDLIEPPTEIARYDGFGAFQASNGRVAYLTAVAGPGGPGSDLWVAERSGQAQRINTAPAVALQWSPDGERLLFLESSPDPAGPALRWAVWSDTQIITFDRFQPTPTFFATYLPFWDQYDRSLSVWSPDSSAFVYTARDEAGVGTVFVQVVSEDLARYPVAAGEFASWSP